MTTVARTIVDLAAVKRKGRLEIVLDDALAGRKVSLDEVVACFDDVARRGKPGVGKLRALLADRVPGYVAPQSRLESRFLRLLRTSGVHVARPALQHPFVTSDGRTLHLDAAFPDLKVAVELDGRRWHTRERDFAVDRERDAELVRAGWVVLRFTWQDVVDRPDWVCETLRAVLARATAA